MDKHYSYMVCRATLLLSTYPSKNIDGKDAEDFVMDVLVENGRLSWHAIKCNIIDAARSKWGRTDRIGPMRRYESEHVLGRLVVHDGDSSDVMAEEIDDIIERMPDLPDNHKEVVRGLAAGIEQAEIAKGLGMTRSGVGRIIDRLVVKLAEDPEWNGLMARYVARHGSRSKRGLKVKEAA